MTGPIPSGRPIRRRTVLLGGLLAVGGCAAGPAPPPPPLPPPPPPPPSAAPPTTRRPAAPEPLLTDVPAYTVPPGEIEPACKETAVAFVTAVLSQGTPGVTDRPLEQRLAALGQPLAPAQPLLDRLPGGGASALEVVYPQYGGLSGRRDSASVMLVADQLVVAGRQDRAVRRRSTTVDVRLHRVGDRWLVHEVRPAIAPPPTDDPSDLAAALLATDRVVLPDAARADLLSGGVHDAVSAAVLALSERWRVHVLVLTGGHPEHVFGTDRTSNHTRGRAVDIWALNGVPVIDRAASPWREAMRAGTDAGASEVGGPEALGLPGHFSDQIHQDHLHLGFGRA